MVPVTRNTARPGARTLEGPGLAHSAGLSDAEIEALEAEFPEGMSVQEIVSAHLERGIRLTEATFRKYVQLGLLPQSVRVGRKGKHRGSQGLYPVSALRQLEEIRRLMGRGFTIEEIQRDFLFVRSDLEELRRSLDRIHEAFEAAIRAASEADVGAEEGVEERAEDAGAICSRKRAELFEALSEARSEGESLFRRYEKLEKQLTLRARMAKAVV